MRKKSEIIDILATVYHEIDCISEIAGYFSEIIAELESLWETEIRLEG